MKQASTSIRWLYLVVGVIALLFSLRLVHPESPPGRRIRLVGRQSGPGFHLNHAWPFPARCSALRPWAGGRCRALISFSFSAPVFYSVDEGVSVLEEVQHEAQHRIG